MKELVIERKSKSTKLLSDLNLEKGIEIDEIMEREKNLEKVANNNN